jgi:hypothetical protein
MVSISAQFISARLRRNAVPHWIEPYAGFRFESDDVVVNRDHQQEKLGAIGVDPGLYGDCVDPSFYIGLGIHAGIEAGISAEGNVNMLSSIVQHRPVALGEPLTSKGEIESMIEVPRGHAVTTNVWFEGKDGIPAISVPRKSLRPAPDKRNAKGAGDRPAPVIEDASSLEILQSYTLSPEATIAYSNEGNAIHYEMAAANKAGFRAPIIGGGMGVHFLMAALWDSQGLEGVDLDIYFRRPIFWDDVVFVGINAERTAIALLKDGKVGTEARINGLAIRQPQ